MDQYKSSIGKDDRKELPLAMVALVATAVSFVFISSLCAQIHVVY